MSDHGNIQNLDVLFDQSPVDLEKIEEILFDMTRGVVDAVLQQRTEGLTTPYMAGLNRLAFEINWRCEENPSDGSLHVIHGRILSLIDVIDRADDTSLSATVIAAVKANSAYLMILQIIESEEDGEVRIEDITFADGNSKHIINWMISRQLIVTADSSIAFGPKGKRTLEAVREELTTSK